MKGLTNPQKKMLAALLAAHGGWRSLWEVKAEANTASALVRRGLAEEKLDGRLYYRLTSLGEEVAQTYG